MRFGRVGRHLALAIVSIVALGAMPGSVFADGNAAPVVTASVSPVSAGERQPVVASATFTDADSTDGFTCQIDYGDGGFFATGTISGNTCTGPGHLYATTGSFVVFVFVTDNLGAGGFGMASVSNYNYPPDFVGGIYLFGGTPQSRPEAGRASVIALPFRDMGSALFGDPIETYTCTVDYGDGTGPQVGTYIPLWSYFSYPTCLGPDHVYQAAGTYTISGTVTDSGNASGSKSGQATVAPPSSLVVTAPADQNITSLMAARYGGNYPYSLGSFVDPNGAGAGPWSYVVDWGDGTGATSGRANSQGALTINHFYLSGSYRGHLTVTNAAGWSGDAYFNVTMASDILLAVVEGHGDATEGVPEPFELICFDPNVYAQTFDIHLDWGDGSTQDIHGASNPVPLDLSHTYVAGGGTIYPGFGSGYTLTATVTNSLGHQKTWSSLVGVQSLAPVITAPPVTIGEGDTGLVTIASFTDVSVGPYWVVVTFPNGYIFQPPSPTPGPIQIPAPALSTGSYQIQVYDHTWMQSTVTVTVQVGNLTPLLYNPTWSTNSGVEGSASSVSVSFSDSGNSGETYTCSVDYGDGAGAQAATISGTLCAGPDHYYLTPGSHAVTISVAASNGAVGTLQTTLIVFNSPPSISSFNLPSLSATGEVVNASAVFGDPGMGLGETYGCWIDFGDGSGTQTGSVAGTACNLPAHVYSQAGTYVATVGVADGHGLADYSTATIHVANRAPSVGPIGIPNPSWVGLSTQAWADFVPGGLTETYTCTVDYGDGNGARPGTISGSTCVGPSSTYNNAGSYAVTITVTGSISGTGAATATVTVATPPVMGALHVPSQTTAGSAISASADFVPSPGLGSTYTCTVDYGDGSGQQAGTVSGSTCQGPGHTYAASGLYSISFNVTEWVTPSASIGTAGSRSIVVGPSTPVVGSVTAPSQTVVGASISASASFTPTGRAETYTCTVDYGDGSGRHAGVITGTTCQGATHKYAATGNFTITLGVTGSIGGSSSASTSIVVSLAPILVAAISVPTSIAEGSTVTASAVFTPIGSQTYTCKVDYGDGIGAQTGTISGTTCKGPSHKYGKPGSVTVTVKVTGSKGNVGIQTKAVTINNTQPAFGKVTLPATAKIGAPITLTASFTDPGTTETYQVYVEWGDGAITSMTLGSAARSFSASHVYSTAGDYGVVVGLADDQMAQTGNAVTSVPVVAVYDPARSITGAGTFASPAGACTLNTKCAVASTATFSVSAAYSKGATKPTASFTFTSTGISFTATSFDWYIVQEGRGVLQGYGKVNGVSGYRFGVFTIDGSPDKIIVGIFDSKGNSVYYNNDYTPLNTGSIVMK